MGRPRKVKQAKMVLDEAFGEAKDGKDRPRDIRLAGQDLQRDMSEAMRLFRRSYKLPQRYTDTED